jgi:hypothetical protein
MEAASTNSFIMMTTNDKAGGRCLHRTFSPEVIGLVP